MSGSFRTDGYLFRGFIEPACQRASSKQFQPVAKFSRSLCIFGDGAQLIAFKNWLSVDKHNMAAYAQFRKLFSPEHGVIESRFAEMSPPNMTHFVQWDLGFTRQDRELYGRRWKRQEARLLKFLDSGRPLTVSAEGKSYELPAIRIRGWKERFRKIC